MKRIFFTLSFISLFICTLTFRSFGQTYTFTYGSLLRDYIVHLPIGYSPNNTYPLVINMHGYTETAAIQEAYTQMDLVADTGKFIVVYPDAIGTAWNCGYGGFNLLVDDVGFLSAMIDTIKSDFSINSNKIFACGMSLGGFMSYRLACELPTKIAAIAPVSGLMGDSVRLTCQNNCSVPVMHIHGTLDLVISYNGSLGYVSADSTISIWIGKDGCLKTPVISAVPNTNTLDGCTVTKYYYGSGRDSSEVVLFDVLNGGHTWPGAIADPALGNTDEDINASAEIWNFFRQHSLKCGVAMAIEDNSMPAEIVLYPNPVWNLLHLTTTIRSEKIITVQNILGEKVLVQPVNPENAYLDVSFLRSGLYIVTIESAGRTTARKFIKQ